MTLPTLDFRLLFNALPGLYLILSPDDPTYTIAAVNQAYARATLTEPRQIVGRGLFQVFPDNPNDPHATGADNLLASLRRVLSTKAPDAMPAQKYDIPRPDSVGGGFEERYWSPVNSPVLDDRGEVLYIVHCVEDVSELFRLKRTEAEQGKLTDGFRARVDQMEAELYLRSHQLSESQRLIRERQEAETKLRLSEERFSLAFAKAPVGMVLLTPEGKITEVNQAYVDMLGYTREELSFQDSRHFTHPDDIGPTRQFFQKLQDPAGSKIVIEKRYFCKDGRTLWVRASGALRRDDQGRPVQVIAIIEDITERKRVEAALRESEELFRKTIDSMPQLVWSTLPDGYHDLYNKRWFEYTGRTFEDTKGEGWKAIFHVDDQPLAWARWRHSLATGEPYEIEYRCRRFDGQYRWFLGRATPIRDQHDRIVRWFGTCTDIHAQKESEVALRRANRELEEFAYVVSHDLQEPLRMVNIYTGLILRKLPGEDPSMTEYVGFVRSNLLRMEKMIQDLLTFSRTVHSESLSTNDVDLSGSLQEALAVLKSRIQETSASIEVETLPTVAGDHTQLTQVFQNLISNSLKYSRTDQPPRVHVSAERAGEHWIISVKDNGIGFDPQYAERIFGLFKRLHKDAYPGNGLGLAICQRIIERSGGRIWAESRVGEGATFRFSLLARDGVQ